MTKKKLVINTVVCDATKVTEEKLAGYDSITIIHSGASYHAWSPADFFMIIISYDKLQ